MTIKSIKFHIKSDDYFGTLATVLDLLRQTGRNTDKVLKSLTKDLLYLDKNYSIVKKDECRK